MPVRTDQAVFGDFAFGGEEQRLYTEGVECLLGVKIDKSQTKHISSGLPPRADVGADIPISSRWARTGPKALLLVNKLYRDDRWRNLEPRQRLRRDVRRARPR